MNRCPLALLVAALLPQAAAQPRAEFQKGTPPGQATLRVYDGQKLRWQATTQGLTAVTESKFSPDGKWLLNLTDQGYVQLWDVGKGVRVKTFLAPFARVLNADFTPDSGRLMLNFRDDSTGPVLSAAEFWQRTRSSFWSLSPLKRLGTLDVPRLGSGYSGSVHFDAAGKRMVFTSFRRFDGAPASIYDARTGQHLSTISRLPYPKGAPQIGGAGTVAARLSPDGRRVLVLYVDGRLAEYDADTARLLKLRGKPADAQAQLDAFATSGQ